MEHRPDDRAMATTDLSCPKCGTPLPVGVLRAEQPIGDHDTHLLAAGAHSLGRGTDCDVQLGGYPGLSRTHARLAWSANHFTIADESSSHGTFVNGVQVGAGASVPLADGDRVRLGDATFVFQYIQVGVPTAPLAGAERYVRLLRDLMSLEPAEVVPTALEILRQVSGVERSYLVDAGTDPNLRAWLMPLDDASLRVSRTILQQVFDSGQKASVFLAPDAQEFPTRSMHELRLRRIWVSPIAGRSGRPIAAVYLDSATPGELFDTATERVMDGLVEHIGLALRNASTHSGAISLNNLLEVEVAARVKDLEEAQTRLLAQDHLAKLGRFVGAIAHELNNPVGAIASLSQTLAGLLEPVMHIDTEIDAVFPVAADAADARALLAAALASARQPMLDTRGRRELEDVLRASFDRAGVANSEAVARRMARVGLTVADLSRSMPLLRREADTLSHLCDRVYTFGRGLATISTCALNVAHIVDGLKTYSHLDRSHVEDTDIHASIQVTLAVLAPRIPPDVTVETRFGSVAAFPHRPGEMIQVWTNLLDNALNAVGDRGHLLIESTDEGDSVRIDVCDNGEGIPPDLGARIFELDVTTRGPGAGLGLGLPICRTIVEKSHGGRITFKSRPGSTTFTVTLPKHASQ